MTIDPIGQPGPLPKLGGPGGLTGTGSATTALTPVFCASACLRKLEGLKLLAYPDPASGGEPWTIGYGNTAHLDGSPVRPGDHLPDEAAARALMDRALGLIAPRLLGGIRVPLKPNEAGALISWAYNVGTGSALGSTLVRLLNEGASRAAVAAQFDRWVMGDGHIMQGLVNRRHVEKAVFLGTLRLW